MSWETIGRVWQQYQTDSPTKKLILVRLADMATDNGLCFPGMQKIARECGVSVRSARRLLAELEEEGAILRFGRFKENRQTSNIYFVIIGLDDEEIRQVVDENNLSTLKLYSDDAQKWVGMSPMTPPPVTCDRPPGHGCPTPRSHVTGPPVTGDLQNHHIITSESPHNQAPWGAGMATERTSTTLATQPDSAPFGGPAELDIIHPSNGGSKLDENSLHYGPSDEDIERSGVDLDKVIEKAKKSFKIHPDFPGQSEHEFIASYVTMMVEAALEEIEQAELMGDYDPDGVPQWNSVPPDTEFQRKVLRACRTKSFQGEQQRQAFALIERQMANSASKSDPRKDPLPYPKDYVDSKIAWAVESNANGKSRIVVASLLKAINNPTNYQTWLARVYWPAKTQRKERVHGFTWP